MMPAANQGVGMNMGFPDVCTTPAAPAPIPVPYPNMGMNAMAMPFVPNVLVSMAPGQNMSSKPMLTNGDNAGVAHPLFMQPGGTIMGNPMILMGGMPASHLGAPSYGNNFNNPVGAKTVPSITNVLLGCASLLDPATNRAAARTLLEERGTSWTSPRGIAVVRLPAISLRADGWLEQVLEGLDRATTRGLALDLRANPGGSIRVATSIYRALADSGLRLALAVDGGTASAAELLAALLIDRCSAQAFGQRTLGKGWAQPYTCSPTTLRPASPRRAFLRPTGAPIDDRGVAATVTCAPEAALTHAVAFLDGGGSR